MSIRLANRLGYVNRTRMSREMTWLQEKELNGAGQWWWWLMVLIIGQSCPSRITFVHQSIWVFVCWDFPRICVALWIQSVEMRTNHCRAPAVHTCKALLHYLGIKLHPEGCHYATAVSPLNKAAYQMATLVSISPGTWWWTRLGILERAFLNITHC